MLRTIIHILVTCGFFLYPLFIYFGIQQYSPRLIALVIGTGVAMNVVAERGGQYRSRLLFPVIGTVLLCLISAVLNHLSALLYLPFFISLNLCLTFSYSLLHPPSMIEVFARMSTDTLPDEAIWYCRLVTQIWVGFFVLNGSLAGLSACCAPLAVWSVYNGLIAYCGVGILFSLELCYRYWRFRHYTGAPTDFLFKRIFPPKE